MHTAASPRFHHISDVDHTPGDETMYTAILAALFSMMATANTFFHPLHHKIRLYSRLNRRHRLKTFMKESSNFMLRHQILDWHRLLHCAPNRLGNQSRCITNMEPHKCLKKNLTALSHTIKTYILMRHTNLIPFRAFSGPYDTAVNRLPLTKALAPDGMPAILWRHFASELT